jgi:pantoate--beta-alanine ligase
MHVFSAIDPLRRHLSERRRESRIVLVPTMGALHAGHGACIARARDVADATVVCSIFVNPTQFGDGEDLSRYPRTPDADRAFLEAAGCDVLFAPGPTTMYPAPQTTWVEPGPMADPLDGAFRPGHFRGVATVVAKLFHIVAPAVAVFGQKDAQQALIIRAMTRQLNQDVGILLVPTVREADGLAMSSRNAHLSPGARRRAAGNHTALVAAAEAKRAGERDARALETAVRAVLLESGIDDIDYVEARNAGDLSALERLEGRVILAVAVRVGGTRLIDNMVFEVGERRVRTDVPLFDE